MYVVIRKFQMRSVQEAAQRAMDGLVPILRQMDGFRDYVVFDCGDGRAGSVSFFENRQAADAANARALQWIRENLAQFVDGEPEIVSGEVVGSAGGRAERPAA